MTDALASWQEENARYLSAAVGWLRALLDHQIEHPGTSLPTPRTSSSSPPENASTAQAKIGTLRPPTSVWLTRMLRRRLGLSHFEQEVLLLCAAMELDTSIGALCARAQGDLSRVYPTFALAFTLF